MDLLHLGIPSLTTVTVVGLIVSLALTLLYHAGKPKPIPGIPYNGASAGNLLGDVPAITYHTSAQPRAHSSPTSSI
jgi:hypothetical protein